MREVQVPVVDGPVDMTSGFRTASRPNHNGADFFPARRGAKLPILSLDGGEVVLARYGHPKSGNWLEVLQDDGLTLTYKHLDSIGAAIGQRVARGQRIGTMGKSGDATGIHLHLEMRQERRNNGGRNAIDPMPLLLARMGETEKEAGTMEIIQRPSPNRSTGRQGHRPDVIACHITDGNFPGSVDWVTNPASQVSYHFMVSRAGEVTQCVEIADTAWANGTTTNGDSRDSQNSALAIVRERRANANLYTVSMGFEGVHRKTNGSLAPAQLGAGARLMQHIRGEAGRLFGVDIPMARTHIVGHFEIAPLWRPNCPGADFPFDEMIRALNEGTAPAPTAVQPQAASAPASGRVFRVRVGNFAAREEADAERDRLRASGHGGAFTVQDGCAWQAQAASGPSLGGAEALAEALRAQGFNDVAVV